MFQKTPNDNGIPLCPIRLFFTELEVPSRSVWLSQHTTQLAPKIKSHRIRTSKQGQDDNTDIYTFQPVKGASDP